MTSYNLTGKTVLVTGAASGIGAASARAMIDAGANVALVDLHQAAVDKVATELGPNALPLAADVTDLQAMQTVVTTIVDHFGALDVCFANAGIAASKPTTIRGSSVEEFERIVEVDLLGVWRTVKASLSAVTAANGHFAFESHEQQRAAHDSPVLNAPPPCRLTSHLLRFASPRYGRK